MNSKLIYFRLMFIDIMSSVWITANIKSRCKQLRHIGRKLVIGVRVPLKLQPQYRGNGIGCRLDIAHGHYSYVFKHPRYPLAYRLSHARTDFTNQNRLRSKFGKNKANTTLSLHPTLHAACRKLVDQVRKQAFQSRCLPPMGSKTIYSSMTSSGSANDRVEGLRS